ncbi:MAG: UDP-N-acetylglucosamine--N-acetylmuramyl-(pentapeptide) pyrophosphoryl-undecaprenol N-acetylglucosamine transferase [Parcubacteria group bacterium]|nr:UDP-N-acetylglucosamine--N-acetylmuramyl-(pentapeptide) pyrophosphoryl-undecaprenol N-acetylglucosamine transferase [Parcubacteria group bacterium]
MKIIFTGGGSGGHFYPIIAVIEAIRDLQIKERLLPAELYFISDHPYDKQVLFENEVSYIEIRTGKRRTYASARNFSDIFRTALAVLKAIWTMYRIFPDVVFGKGGYASFPTLFAARLFGIPVVIHESDAVPGRVNAWASKFARAIAVSYPEAVSAFPKDKAIATGNPIRKEILTPITHGAHEFLGLEEGIPILLVLGGSQGSKTINEAMLDGLPLFLERYQIVHQVGEQNQAEVTGRLEGIFSMTPHQKRYKMYPYLNDLALRMAAGVADVVISRAGSAIFEIASWGRASIIVPITESVGDHQRHNAFHYARAGAAVVVEEANLTPRLLLAEIDRIMENKKMKADMEKAALRFAENNATAAEKIAREVLILGLKHDSK